MKKILVLAAMSFCAIAANAQSIVRVTEQEADASINNGKLVVQRNGQVLIGVTTDDNSKKPAGYNLIVTKGILTERLRVANYDDATNWADYVFSKEYRLMPLKEVEAYVHANKHLPGIPAATEVRQDGVDVVAMEAKLLEKIEELTLHAIRQQKEIDELREKLQTR